MTHANLSHSSGTSAGTSWTTRSSEGDDGDKGPTGALERTVSQEGREGKIKSTGRVRKLEGQCGKGREEVIVYLTDRYGGKKTLSEEERAEVSRSTEREIARQRAENKGLIFVIAPLGLEP